jgi:DNA-binding MarR family transcriptional regulator
VTKQAIHAPLRRLVSLNLVAMAEDDGDRRMKKLALTPEGKALEVELTGAQMEHLARAFDAASPGDKAGWTRVMDRLARGR